MDRHLLRRSPFRLFIGAGVVAWMLAFAAAAAPAAIPEGGSDADARRVRVEPWKGRYCTPSGCAGASASPWGSAAGFGIVVLASGWVARRRSASND